MEQDSDVVMLLYPDEENPEAIKINIAKDRSGAHGTIRLRFDRPTTTLSDWDPEPAAARAKGLFG